VAGTLLYFAAVLIRPAGRPALALNPSFLASRHQMQLCLLARDGSRCADLKPIRFQLRIVAGRLWLALHIVIDAVMTTSIAKWMIHGHANVLDGQRMNDAAHLGSSTLGFTVR